MTKPIAVQGIIRCTKCGAIFRGKGDDIAPLGGRSIFPFSDIECAICDQWGHTASDLEWFPDVELPEDMDELKWPPVKILEQINLLKENGLMTKKDLHTAIMSVWDDWISRVEKRYGSDRLRTKCGTTSAFNSWDVLRFLADEGQEYNLDRNRLLWAKQLEKDHPLRVAAEATVAAWHSKYSDVNTWDAEYDPEVHVLTISMLFQSQVDLKYDENFRSIREQLFNIESYNGRIAVLTAVVEAKKELVQSTGGGM